MGRSEALRGEQLNTPHPAREAKESRELWFRGVLVLKWVVLAVQ